MSARESFFQFKKELDIFSEEVDQLTVQYEQKINRYYSIDMIECVSHLYDAMRFQVDCTIGKYTGQDRERSRKHGMDRMKRCLGWSHCKTISYDTLLNKMEEKGKPLLLFLEHYKKEILHLYQKRVPFVFHVSAVPNIRFLQPSVQRENMYYNEICNAVFATSNYNEILLYIGRISGNEMAVRDQICLYWNNPYESWDDSRICLKERAVVYFLDAEEFEPVIDFLTTDKKEAGLKFGHEWIHRGTMPICKSEQVMSIPTKDMMSYQLFYGKNHVSLAPYIDELKKESNLNKIEDGLQKMVDIGLVTYINFQKRNSETVI